MRSLRVPSTICLLLAQAAVFNSAIAQDEPPKKAARHITLDDYGAIHSPYSPLISPDGQQIAYWFEDRVFLVSPDGSESEPVTSAEAAASPHRWSADGKSILYLSDSGEGRQVYSLQIGGSGEATQLTKYTHGVASLNLSPDETRVLLAISDNDLREKATEPQPIVVTRTFFKRDSGNGYIVDGDLKHLHVYDIEKQAMRQVTSGPFAEGGAAWSPDGKSIVFTSNHGAEFSHGKDLWIVAAGSTEKEPPLLRLTDSPRRKNSPSFSPDGTQIAYLSAVDGEYGVFDIAVIPAAGGEPRLITTDLDRRIASFKYSKDGNWIYFNYQNSGAVNLARVRVSDGTIETLLDGDQVVRSFDVSKSGDIAVAANIRNDSNNIFGLRGSKLTQLTDLNRNYLDEIELGNKSKVSFESADGTIVEAFITTPPDYEPGRAYPAILKIHGGPQSQYAWGIDFTAQFFASNGYVVIEPNPRGSTGRGAGFIDALYRAWGVPDYDDVIAAVDYAIAEGIADPERLAVTGYSYGGYLTNVVITRTNRFKAAASTAGSSLTDASFGHDIYLNWYMWELGVPWENREKYDVHSPVLRAGNVATPTIFLGGQVDWNMPILHAELFYQALKIRGIDTELVVYPGMHHGGWPDRFEKDFLVRILDWFDGYTGGQ